MWVQGAGHTLYIRCITVSRLERMPSAEEPAPTAKPPWVAESAPLPPSAAVRRVVA